MKAHVWIVYLCTKRGIETGNEMFVAAWDVIFVFVFNFSKYFTL